MFTKIGTITLGVSDQDKALGGILTRRVGTANGTSPATYFIEVAQQLLAIRLRGRRRMPDHRDILGKPQNALSFLGRDEKSGGLGQS